MNKLKNTKGITLVALVVTIIVLIILAGVSISLIIGQDGVVQKAKQGRDNYADAARLENEQLANVDAFALTIGGPSEPEEPETPIDPNKYIKFSDGTEKTVGGAESLKADYEKQVHADFFTSNEGSNWKWQLFYDDSQYIFLIATDYVTKAAAPVYNNGNANFNTTNGNLYNNASVNATYNFQFCSNSNYNNYVLANGTAYKSGSATPALTSNPLTSKYLRWVGLNSSRTNYNIQAVAFMMDRDKWSQFANDTTHNYANAFAIGGPTVELFTKSWNAFPGHSTTKLGEYAMTAASSGVDWNATGYYLWNRGSNIWSSNGNSNDLGSSANMWHIRSTNKAQGYWLAAPTYADSPCLATVRYEGYLNYAYIYDTYYGFRPVVVIPKASL